jgi:tRNA threonylcarbamoyladenosine biosynthesis protein TsaB
MIDARRMEVYSAIFAADFERVRDVRAEIINRIFKKTLYFVGDCTESVQLF